MSTFFCRLKAKLKKEKNYINKAVIRTIKQYHGIDIAALMNPSDIAAGGDSDDTSHWVICEHQDCDVINKLDSLDHEVVLFNFEG